MSTINFIRGVNNKPNASRILEEALSKISGLTGECFFGFPLLATPEGKYAIDAILVSPQKGVILFDLVEGTRVDNLHDYASRQDDLANKMEAKLKTHRDLVKGRQLIPPLQVITFAPAISTINTLKSYSRQGYPLTNANLLVEALNEFEWSDADDKVYRTTLSAVESMSSIRKGRSKRDIQKRDSRGKKLRDLEDAIATLDSQQSRAVIETVDGVQRIRGLAGSGKTIVLALKAAYLHTQYPEWRIAVTFHTRSLKGLFKRLIYSFCIDQSGEEPDWTRLRIVNSWGAPGGDERDGIYYEFCRTTGQKFYDFRSARTAFGAGQEFDGACRSALLENITPPQLYDAILVDEAQDFTPSFLRLCYAMLKPPKRLVYAYDELQNLSGVSLPPPEDIFGKDDKGDPVVALGNDARRDVILNKCYRNSRPVLVTAHALGFGIYREPPKDSDTGIVQMFDYPALWEEVGYRVHAGELAKGKRVVLGRTDETSPLFLEQHSGIDDLVVFHCFDKEADQNDWLVNQIQKNLEEDELRYDDIIVIHPDPLTARENFGPIREVLFDLRIPNHIAGVDTDPDIFFKNESPSITFTSIYRAKGNEAGMVYVINAQHCNVSGAGLASLRNRLFTAITRSKAWVRVVGHGDGMRKLQEEFERLRRRDFKLDFIYPSDEQLRRLRIVHRDLSPDEKKRLEGRKEKLAELVEAFQRGELNPEDIDEDTRQKLIQMLTR